MEWKLWWKFKNLLIKDITNDLKKSDARKIQIMIAINFMSSKGNEEDCIMHSKSNNIVMSHDKADEAIEQLFWISSF